MSLVTSTSAATVYIRSLNVLHDEATHKIYTTLEGGNVCENGTGASKPTRGCRPKRPPASGIVALRNNFIPDVLANSMILPWRPSPDAIHPSDPPPHYASGWCRHQNSVNRRHQV